LELLEVRGVHNEGGDTMLSGIRRTASLAEDINGSSYLLVLHANKQRDIASAKKATGACDARHTVVLSYQLVNHPTSINVT
jgi:hypothetical protein